MFGNDSFKIPICGQLFSEEELKKAGEDEIDNNEFTEFDVDDDSAHEASDEAKVMIYLSIVCNILFFNCLNMHFIFKKLSMHRLKLFSYLLFVFYILCFIFCVNFFS
jgi:hypothetical protein